MKILLVITMSLFLTVGCSTPHSKPKDADNNNKSISKVIRASEVKWEKLNPARGEKSPKAATLWGDRKGAVPTGFLVKFVDGFSSPPHIHNV